jgi:hypothetical protein
LRFTQREGHSRVLKGYRDDDGFKLGMWVKSQRARRGQLSEVRRQRLEALPRWVWAPRDVAWEEAFTRLLRFTQREGHSRVPPGYRDEDGFTLGQWVINERVFRRSDKLSDEQKRRLEDVPGWVWDPPSGPRPSRRTSDF